MVSPTSLTKMGTSNWSPLLGLTVLICCFAAGCEKEQTQPYQFTELAMRPGMLIEANNKNGTVKIEYVSSLKRCFSWEGVRECRTLQPREERYRGSLGIYDPAPAYVWEFYKKRIVSEDAQMHFADTTEMMAWLKQGSDVFDWVYSDDGLVVGFAKAPDRQQVNVYVYQVFVGEEKPIAIKGSRPKNIRVSFRQNSVEDKMH